MTENINPKIETQQLPVIVQTETNRIRGKMHLRENERIKDALNTSELFIAVTEVRIFDEAGLSLLYETAFLAINRTKVIWVVQDGANLGLSNPDEPQP